MWRAYKDFWVRGTRFRGKTTRSQYWLTTFINYSIGLCLMTLGLVLIERGYFQHLNFEATHHPLSLNEATWHGLTFPMGLKSAIEGVFVILIEIAYLLVSLVPRFALIVRRFHDVGLSGCWFGAIFISKCVSDMAVVYMMVCVYHSLAIFPMPNLLVIIRGLSTLLAIILFGVEVMPTGLYKRPFLCSRSNNRE